MTRMESVVRYAPLALLAIAVGCYSYYPYGYGPSGPYGMPPGAFTGPGTVPGAMPQGAYINPQDFGGSGTTVNPGNTPPPAGSGSSGQWQGSGTTGAPAATNPSGTENRTFEKPVPNPDVLDTPPAIGPSGAAVDPATNRGAAETNNAAPSVRPDPVAGNDPFAAPAHVRSVSRQEQPHRPSPYAYDSEGYTWLRGVLSFDETERKWHLTYVENPAAADRFGGNLTLVSDEDFSNLRPQDVVLVEGRIDDTCRDRFGKPCYRVTRVIGPLVPDE